MDLCVVHLSIADLCRVSQVCKLLRDLANREIRYLLSKLFLRVDVFCPGEYFVNNGSGFSDETDLEMRMTDTGRWANVTCRWSGYCCESNKGQNIHLQCIKNGADSGLFTFTSCVNHGNDKQRDEWYCFHPTRGGEERVEEGEEVGDVPPTFHVYLDLLNSVNASAGCSRVRDMFSADVPAELLPQTTVPAYRRFRDTIRSFLMHYKTYNYKTTPQWNSEFRLGLIDKGEVLISPAPENGEKIRREETQPSKLLVNKRNRGAAKGDEQRWSISYDIRALTRSEIESNPNGLCSWLSFQFDMPEGYLPDGDIHVDAISNIKVSVPKKELIRTLSGQRFCKQ
eukprot:Nk52_evm23s317 gene=Nk52_evmTU23s317